MGATGPKSHATGRVHSPGAVLLREVRSVIAVDGVRGIYRGYGWCLATSAPCNAAYFGAYSTARRNLSGSGPLHDAAAGLVAETVASLVWTPADVVKQRLQVGGTRQRIADTLQAACTAGGVSGLWRGYFAGLMVWGPFSSVYFMSYEVLLRQFVGKHDARSDAKAGDNLICGVSAGSIAALTTQPLDCAKTRIQVGAVPQSARLIPTVMDIWRSEGAHALWRGAAARVLWLAPGCGISITVFERVAAALEGKV